MSAIPVIIQGRDETSDAFKSATAGAQRLAKKVDSTQARIDATMKKTVARTNAFGDAFKNVQARMSENAGTGLVGGLASVGLRAASQHIIELGNNATETDNLVKESFGGMTGQADAWSKALQRSVGVSARETQRQAAVFNTMFDSMGIGQETAFDMSKGLTQLSGDMASFYNLSGTEAFDKLRAGITGEAEPLKALGILLNEETVKQHAYAAGIAKTGAKLTEQEKVLARYVAIMAQTKKAQGDLTRTKISGANLARAYETAKNEALTTMGKGAAGVRSAELRLVTPLMNQLSTRAPGALQAAGAGLEVASQAAPILTTSALIGQSLPVWDRLSERLRGAGTAGPAAGRAFTVANAGLRSSAIAGTFAGNAHAASALKIRAASLTAGNALKGAGAALAAVAVTAYGLDRLKTGLEKAAWLSDEELIRQEGAWGRAWVKGGQIGANVIGAFTGENARGAVLDRQAAALRANPVAPVARQVGGPRRTRDGYKTTIEVRIPESRVERSWRNFSA